MNGKQLDAKLARSAWKKVSAAKKLVCPYLIREVVANLQAPGVQDSVSQQVHRVDARWSEPQKSLEIFQSNTGPWYCIPYLGKGIPNVGTPGRGLGTYTPLIAPGGAISWVITGPFSGCHAMTFSSGAHKAFAHVVTVSNGPGIYTAAPVDTQIADIEQMLNARLRDRERPDTGGRWGFVLWTYIDNVWYRRTVLVKYGGWDVLLSLPRKPIR